MKDLFKLALVLIVAGLVFVGSGLLAANYTSSAIGVLLLGLGATIVLGKETELKKEVYIAIWAVVLILIAVLIRYGGELPKLTIG